MARTSERKLFFDTSVLVAVFYGDHPQHARSIAVFQGATPRHAFCALHTVAEVYAVMSRLPVRPLIAPEQALLFLESLRERVAFVGLDASEYFTVIAQAASNRMTGGRIYDALICGCARKVSPTVIFTLNVRHFAELAPDLADRMRTP